MAKGKAETAETKAAKAQAEVDGFVHAAVLRAATESSPLKLQAAKGKDDGLFPAAPPKPVKAAIEAATAGDEPLLRVAGGTGKAQVYELAPQGVRAVGRALEHAAQSMPAAEAIRQAEQVLEKLPDTAVELVPLIERLATLQREEAEQEAKRRKADAERQERVIEAMKRYQAVIEQAKRDRIAVLQNELADLGGRADTAKPSESVADSAELNRLSDEVARLKGELRTAKAASTDQSGVAPEDSQDYVRNVARRLVSAWSEAAEKGMEQARNALEVVLGNVAAIDQIGEEGDSAVFDPERHECSQSVPPGTEVVITRPGWVLQERAGAEYVITKAKVDREG